MDLERCTLRFLIYPCRFLIVLWSAELYAYLTDSLFVYSTTCEVRVMLEPVKLVTSALCYSISWDRLARDTYITTKLLGM